MISRSSEVLPKQLQHPTEHHRWYFGLIGAGAIAIAIAGFAPGLLSPAARRGPLNALVITHALLTSAWLLLFVLQSWLVAARRIQTHRRIGVASVALAALVLISGYFTVIEQTRRGYDLPMLAFVFFTPAVYDRIRFGRFHGVTLWAGILLFVWGNLRAIVIGPSAAWHGLMSWLVG